MSSTTVASDPSLWGRGHIRGQGRNMKLNPNRSACATRPRSAPATTPRSAARGSHSASACRVDFVRMADRHDEALRLGQALGLGEPGAHRGQRILVVEEDVARHARQRRSPARSWSPTVCAEVRESRNSKPRALKWRSVSLAAWPVRGEAAAHVVVGADIAVEAVERRCHAGAAARSRGATAAARRAPDRCARSAPSAGAASAHARSPAPRAPARAGRARTAGTTW